MKDDERVSRMLIASLASVKLRFAQNGRKVEV